MLIYFFHVNLSASPPMPTIRMYIGWVKFHTMYEKNENLVKNSFDPMFRTNNSSKNFTSVRIINVFNENNSDTRIFAFAKSADVKNRKNKGLVNKVNFELDDHLILWFIYENNEFFRSVVTKLFLS